MHGGSFCWGGLEVGGVVGFEGGFDVEGSVEEVVVEVDSDEFAGDEVGEGVEGGGEEDGCGEEEGTGWDGLKWLVEVEGEGSFGGGVESECADGGEEDTDEGACNEGEGWAVVEGFFVDAAYVVAVFIDEVFVVLDFFDEGPEFEGVEVGASFPHFFFDVGKFFSNSVSGWVSVDWWFGGAFRHVRGPLQHVIKCL